MKRRIGILNLSGPDCHGQAIERLGHEAVSIEQPHDLDKIQGLIISGRGSAFKAQWPSGDQNGWESGIKHLAARDLPIFGFGVGMVMLAKYVTVPDCYHLPLMDVTVQPDALGGPDPGLAVNIAIPALGKALLSVVFVQAPYAVAVAPNVGILGEHEQKIVFIRQGNLIAASFHIRHPSEVRVHQYFLDMVEDY